MASWLKPARADVDRLADRKPNDELGPADVHVWCARLDDAAAADKARAILSVDERERADRFHFERDRRRFTNARATLRVLLGRYLGMPPCDVIFGYGEYGKPALGGGREGSLRFNVSHSGELALFAIARTVEVGVDIEALRDLPDAEEIATRFFSPREVQRLLSCAPAARHAAFFRCWTRKEAYLKALGSGLARPLDEFDVTFAPGETPSLSVPGNQRESDRWQLHDLAAADGYAAALVVEGAAIVRTAAWTEPAALECV
jgi:4'-phosphopantetheinyl transferase